MTEPTVLDLLPPDIHHELRELGEHYAASDEVMGAVLVILGLDMAKASGSEIPGLIRMVIEGEDYEPDDDEGEQQEARSEM